VASCVRRSRSRPLNTYVIQGPATGPLPIPARRRWKRQRTLRKVKDLFFVADGSRWACFAETLGRRNRNVARWRQDEGEPRAIRQPPLRLAPASPVFLPRPGDTRRARRCAGDTATRSDVLAGGRGARSGARKPSRLFHPQRAPDAAQLAPAPLPACARPSARFRAVRRHNPIRVRHLSPTPYRQSHQPSANGTRLVPVPPMTRPSGEPGPSHRRWQAHPRPPRASCW